jgi:hypothetical protein
VREDMKGSAAVNRYQRKLRSTYLSHLRRNNRAHFGTPKKEKGPLESIFKKLDLKPIIFGTYGEMSNGVNEVLEIDVDYCYGCVSIRT